MRLLCGFVLAALLSVLPLALGGGNASAGIVCGMFDGKFSCRSESKAGAQFGKNATPGAKIETPEDSPQGTPGGAEQGATGVDAGQGTPGGTLDAATTCQHGMTGTPPDNCHCPKNSELLGGNCVHYTATCSNELASDALPQACPGAEEKLACKMRQDGLKDCCCLTYDKF